MAAWTKIGPVVGFGLVLALFTWGSLTDSWLLGAEGAEMFSLVICLLAGFVMRRWWALLALLGPLFVLTVLELTDYVTSAYLEWGDRPLASPPGIASLIFECFFVLLGIGLAYLGGWLARWWVEIQGRRAR